jgi:chromosome segregation ATPase
MEIHQRPQSLLIFLLIILLGCTSNNEKTQNEEFEEELTEVNKNAKRQQELLKKWFKDFQKVQEEVFSINTNELLVLENELESPKKRKTDKEKIIEKIDQIKLLLKQKDEKLKQLSKQLHNSGHDFTYLEKMVYSLKKDIKLKKNKISDLEQRYNAAVHINDSLSSVKY